MPPLTEKHCQIVDAAVAEFQERGFQGASMDRIAERANVSKRTVYNHFESKQALFAAICELIFEKLDAALTFVYEPNTPLKDQLIAIGRAESGLLTSEGFMRLVRMALGETIRDPDLAAEMNAKSARISVFRDFMEQAAADGAIASDNPDDAAEQFVGLIKSRAFWPHVMSGTVVDPAAMEDIVQTSVETFMARFAKKD